MKKLLRNWKLIFGIILILLCALFYLNQLYIEKIPPSKEWSREITIKEITNREISDFEMVQTVAVPVASENKFYVFWNEKTSINYVALDKDGARGKVKKINIKHGEPIQLKAALQGRLINIYVLEDGILTKYSFDYSKEIISAQSVVAKGVTEFALSGAYVVITGDNYVKVCDKEGVTKLIDDNGGEAVDVNKAGNGLLRIAYAGNTVGMFRIKYASYDPKTGAVKAYDIGRFATSDSGPQNIDNIVIGCEEDNIHVILPIRSSFKEDSRVILYSFKEGNPEKVETNYLDDINGYNVSPELIEAGSGEMAFTASVFSLKGSKRETYNIRKFIIKSDIVIPKEFLTKTNDISFHQHHFTLGKVEYLQWENVTGSSKKIMFASTNKHIISEAGRISSVETVNAFLNSLLSIVFGLTMIPLAFSLTMIPTLVFLIIISIMFLNWVESNSFMTYLSGIAVHMIADIILTYYLILKNPYVLKLIPGFMHSKASVIVMVFLISLISYICTFMRYRDNKIFKSFMSEYASFGIMNMILYSLLFFPYYFL